MTANYPRKRPNRQAASGKKNVRRYGDHSDPKKNRPKRRGK